MTKQYRERKDNLNTLRLDKTAYIKNRTFSNTLLKISNIVDLSVEILSIPLYIIFKKSIRRAIPGWLT